MNVIFLFILKGDKNFKTYYQSNIYRKNIINYSTKNVIKDIKTQINNILVNPHCSIILVLEF